MKNLLVPTILMAALTLAGCMTGPAAIVQATSTPAISPTVQPTRVKVDLPFKNQAILTTLAQQLGITEDQISLLSVQEMQWPDSCLGLPKKGAACLDVITPGYVLVFSTPQGEYTFHTNQDGARFLEAPTLATDQLPVITWERSGGIAGICQRLSIYANGSFSILNCKTMKITFQARLPDKDWAYLEGMVKTYGTFQWKPLASAGAADSFQDLYDFKGLGAEVLAVDQQQALNAYLSNLVSELTANKLSTASETSGIEGQALYGPVCPGPVVDGDPKCADQPYQATIMVLDPNGKTITQFQTGADGKFRVPLVPGNYILHPQSGKPMPGAADMKVTISAGQYAQVTISFDSGIR